MDPLTKTKQFQSPPSEAAPAPVTPRAEPPSAPAEDALRLARGILFAVLFGLVLWGALFFLVWLIFLR